MRELGHPKSTSQVPIAELSFRIVSTLLDVSHGFPVRLNFLRVWTHGSALGVHKAQFVNVIPDPIIPSALIRFGRASTLGHKLGSSLFPTNGTGWIFLLPSCFPKSENKTKITMYFILNSKVKNII